MWLQLAIASSVLLGIYDICKKHALAGNAVIPVLFLATLIGSLPFFVLLAVTPVAPLPPLAHLQIFVKGVIVASSWTFAFFALKHLPISIAAPIRSSAPIWTLLGALVLFGERLNLLQWSGVVVTFGGYYYLALTGRKESIHFASNRWIGFLAAGTLLGAASALYDKFLLLRYPPLAMQAWFYVYLVALLSAVFAFGWWPRRHRHTPFRWRFTIPLIGLLLAAADWVYFHAVAVPGAMISLISIVRRSSVVIAFLVGGHLFRELNRKDKALALLAILCGITLIALSR